MRELFEAVFGLIDKPVVPGIVAAAIIIFAIVVWVSFVRRIAPIKKDLNVALAVLDNICSF